MSNIKKIRVGLQVSQVEFAKMLGTTQVTISSWENGKCPVYIDTLAEWFLNKNAFTGDFHITDFQEVENIKCDKCKGEIGTTQTTCLDCGNIEYY